MADGCNLYFTEKDLADVKNSIAKKKVIDEGKFAANALDCLVKNNHVDFIKVLENRFDPRYELICKLAIVSFGKGLSLIHI